MAGNDWIAIDAGRWFLIIRRRRAWSITCPSCGAALAFDLQAPDEDGDADDEELPEDGADRD